MRNIAGNVTRKYANGIRSIGESPHSNGYHYLATTKPQAIITPVYVSYSMTANSKEISRSINSLLRLSPADQSSLLEVIEDYFSYPSISSVHDPEDSYSDDDIDDMELESGTTVLKITKVVFRNIYN